jgi:O-antigen/teichoic acid export membrane protein
LATDATDAVEVLEAAEEASSGYVSGARILSVGIASTGLFTFAYFSVASHVLTDAEYGAISLLWSILFVAMSVFYRPVEQLLARSIAQGRGGALRTPVLIQAAFATTFLAAALALHGPLVDLFDGSEALFWVFVVAAVAYAASYFARGWFAGHQRFALYGLLVLFESIARFCFPLAVAVGLTTGQTAVAIGIAAAPLASLLVTPWAYRDRTEHHDAVDLREGSGFALGVAGVQLAEQTLLNAAVLVVAVTSNSDTVSVVFSALLIARAPLQLFQAVQTSLLPHLSGGGDVGAAIGITVRAITAFAVATAVGLLIIGPFAMDVFFGIAYDYGRVGLALLACGMGFHLIAGTLNQAALARGQAGQAAATWLICAAAFVIWMILGPFDELLRTEVGYLGAAALLAVALYVLYRRGEPAGRAAAVAA